MNTLHDMMVKSHAADLMRDAEAHRLANQVEMTKKSNVLLASLGRQMVKLGEQLAGDKQHTQLKPELQLER
jgi:hypothetical protein